MNVMITGASGGLGRAMAVECACRGANLFLTDLNEEALRCLKGGLERQFGVNVAIRACDLTDRQRVDELLQFIDVCRIRFDVLLNIAGIDFEGAFLKRTREEPVDIVVLNDAATLRITHAILQRRRKDRAFTVVFVSSLAAMFSMPLKATYAASKRFLLDFAAALQQEVKEDKIQVLTLCPGGMATNDMVTKAILAQGLWGWLTTNPLERVARKTLDRALQGKSRYVPGAINQALFALGKVVPRSWAATIVYRRWKKRKKSGLNKPLF